MVAKYHPWRPGTKTVTKDGKETIVTLHEQSVASKQRNKSNQFKDNLIGKAFPGQLFITSEDFSIVEMSSSGLKIKPLRRLNPTQERQLAAGLVSRWLRSLCT